MTGFDTPTEQGGEPLEGRAVHTSPGRLRAGGALRDLGNALVSHQADEALLEEIAEQAERLSGLVNDSPARTHAFLTTGENIFERPAPAGDSRAPRTAFPDCVISGMANPMGVAAHLWREGDEAVCQVTLGAAFEGAPGRAHGGIVAALLDETMGLVMSMSQAPAFTGRLSVTYRAPTPVGVALEARAHLQDRTGRKMVILAELRAAGQLLAEAEGLFIIVDPDKFFAATDPGGNGNGRSVDDVGAKSRD
jgi:acyl-coenzyme A thioesterase PaaI-like protein